MFFLFGKVSEVFWRTPGVKMETLQLLGSFTIGSRFFGRITAVWHVFLTQEHRRRQWRRVAYRRRVSVAFKCLTTNWSTGPVQLHFFELFRIGVAVRQLTSNWHDGWLGRTCEALHTTIRLQNARMAQMQEVGHFNDLGEPVGGR